MTKIPLRAYNREIENQIDRGQIDEAIAHCRHILSIYPKHVDTYRLLGKAFLESQRYGDAADILQRVLSSTPDDFVSHVGMSIIREDEGNLDESIWHMERAFEVQPSNSAIQEELRRLYGRRDGFEPPKIRLTRGALARMYFKGELYQQAVAELRAGLVEDPSRLDLQVLLAQAYARSGQHAEAAEICGALLRKLPFCLLANAIMSDVLTSSERTEQTQAFYLRLQALDPYYVHTRPGNPSSESVPEQAVTVERLVYRAEEGKGRQPSWAASLGVGLESEQAAEETPDWLDAGFAGQASEQPAPAHPWEAGSTEQEEDRWTGGYEPGGYEPGGSETPDLESGGFQAKAAKGEIPDWIKDAGWSPSTGAFVEGPMNLDDETEPEASEGSAAEGEIPDWLKAMALENGIEPEEGGSIENPDLPWLSEKPDPGQADRFWEQEGGSEAGAPESAAPEQISAEDTSALDWLNGGQAEETEEIPDWLKAFSSDTPAEAGSAESGETQNTFPDWLGTVSPEEAQQSVDDVLHSAEMPDWLSGAAEEIEEETAPGAPAFDAAVAAGGFGAEDASLPDWLSSEESEPAEAGELPAWLRAQQEPEESPAAANPAESAGWFSAGMEEGGSEPPALGTPAAMPDWLDEFQAEKSPAGSEQPASEPSLSEAPEGAAAADIPDWLLDMEASAEQESHDTQGDTKPTRPHQPASFAAAPVETAAPESASDEGLQEELPDWLAMSQEEEGMENKTPDWETEPEGGYESGGSEAGGLEGGGSEGGGELEQAPANLAAGDTPEEGEMDLDAAFAWLEGLAAKQGAEEAMLLNPEDRLDTPPEWVQAAARGQSEPASKPVEAAPAQVTPQAAPELPEVKEPVSTGEDRTVEESLPAAGVFSSSSSSEPVGSEPAGLEPAGLKAGDDFSSGDMDLDSAMAWMEALAARQGADEALFFKPEDRIETPPDWVIAETAASQSAGPTAEPSTEIPEIAEEEPPVIPPEMPAAPIPEIPAIEAPGVEAVEESFAEDAAQPAKPEWLAEMEAEALHAEELAAEQEALRAGLHAGQPAAGTPPAREEGEEWFEEAIEPLASEPPASEPPASEPPASEPPVPEGSAVPDAGRNMPSWLREMVEPGEESGQPAGPAPEWFEEAAAPEAQKEAPVITPPLPPVEAPEEQAAPAGEVPPLPEWLAEGQMESEDTVEWTPPASLTSSTRRTDLNLASLGELERLPGVGFIMAQDILRYREAHGAFEKVDDLLKVPGFSPSVLEFIRDYAYVAQAKKAEPASPHQTPPPVRKPVFIEAPGLASSDEVQSARQALAAGDIMAAVDRYTALIKSRIHLETVISDIKEGLQNAPEEALLWQALGDAYLRTDQLQEAIEAYNKAEQYLR